MSRASQGHIDSLLIVFINGIYPYDWLCWGSLSTNRVEMSVDEANQTPGNEPGQSLGHSIYTYRSR